MKNLNRVFLIVLSVLVVQGLVGTATAQIIPCAVTLPETVTDPDVGAGGETSRSFAVNSACFWRPTSVEDLDGNPISWIRVTSYNWIGGPGAVVFDVDPNPGFNRTGRIVIEGSAVYTVEQEGQCQVTAGPNPSSGEVFVTYPACGAIVRVDGAATEPVFVDVGVASYEGLVYGPDEMLYALDPTRGLIDIFDPTASYASGPDDNVYDRSTASIEFDPQFARFNQTGSLIVSGRVDLNNSPILAIFHNSPPRPEDGINLTSPGVLWQGPGGAGTLAGVMIDADGAILAVYPSAGSVLRFPLLDAANGLYGGPDTLPIASANGAFGGSRTANRDFFVGTENGLKWYDQFGALQDPCWDTAAVVSAEQSADDTQFFTSIDATGDGELLELPFGYNPCGDPITFSCGDTATNLATFGKPSTWVGPTVVDVALPFTERGAAVFDCNNYNGELVQGIKAFDLDGGGQGFNSFDAYLEFIPFGSASSCRVAVSSEEFSPSSINTVIGNELLLQPSRPLVLPGDNGRMRVWTYTPEVAEDCPPGVEGGDPLYTRNVSAYFKEVNPKLALCHLLGLEDCDIQLLQSLDLEFGDLPDDGRIGGLSPRFSESFLVDQVPPGGFDGLWCGVDPPVENDPPWLVANSGSVVPLDIKPVELPNECGDKTISNLVAILDIWYIPAVNYGTGDTPEADPENPPYRLPLEDVNFTGGGSASDFRSQFAEPNNPRRPYSLNWDTNDRNGQPLPEGWYKLNIIDDSAASTGDRKIYFPPQVVYVYLD